MICYWCYWGWPKPIREIFDDCVELLDGDDDPLRFGPAHVVWEDENWDLAQVCLDDFDEEASHFCYSPDDLPIVRESLHRLLRVPDEFKREPEGYDGEHPENYPPPAHWECRK